MMGGVEVVGRWFDVVCMKVDGLLNLVKNISFRCA